MRKEISSLSGLYVSFNRCDVKSHGLQITTPAHQHVQLRDDDLTFPLLKTSVGHLCHSSCLYGQRQECYGTTGY